MACQANPARQMLDRQQSAEYLRAKIVQLSLRLFSDGDEQHRSRIDAHDSIPIHEVRQILCKRQTTRVQRAAG